MINDNEEQYNYYCYQAEQFYNQNLKFNTYWHDVSIDDLKIDDIIIINYTSNSQRYIYDLYPKFGKIIRIDDSNILENIYLNHNDINASHDWCGYYGNTRSYDYNIIKLYYK